MTKDRYIYELVDKCMLIVCQDNILVENFALCDEKDFYAEMERQFLDCLKLYDGMHVLLIRNEIDEVTFDQELHTVLALIHQNAVKRLLMDFKVFLDKTDIKNKDILLEQLRDEFQREKLDAEYLLNKVQKIRKLEQHDL